MKTTREGYKLLHDGALALADVEENGIRIDTNYLSEAIENCEERASKLTRWLKKQDEWKVWKRTFGDRANLNSTVHLGRVLFNEMGLESYDKTPTGRPKTDESALEKIDSPFVKRYLERRKVLKVKDTFLKGIWQECVGEFLHPFFNLDVARTLRSSSDSPNFQNIPIRDPLFAKLVRSCFIPRDGYQIVEIDYGRIEVHAATWYHHDPTMEAYLHDPKKDMHRDTAAEIYCCGNEDVTKDIRHAAKNQFVFPEFYGDWFKACASSLWASIDRQKMEIGGESIKEHLKKHGIKKLGDWSPKRTNKPPEGTFERHVQKVEESFWYERFPVYTKWKESFWRQYQKQAGFMTLTGFYMEGDFSKKDVINYPVQGVAFHCLLWSIIRLNRWLKKNKMKSKIVGQIHDSIVADVHESELEDFLYMAHKIMTQMILKYFTFITTPLEVEAEVCPPGKSWYHKKPRELAL